MPPSFPSHASKRAVALVIVLAFLALICGLILAFFSSVTTELSSSRAYAAGSDTRQLADTAVQVVMSQIRQATAPLPKGAPLAWASQPGMIRVFGTPEAASSQPYAYYKLYSSDQMVITRGFAQFKPESDLAAYAQSPELYFDLNRPVLVPDPAGPVFVDGIRYRVDYPIFDPAAVGYVEGIGEGPATPGLVNPPGGYAGTFPPKPDYNPVASPNPAPMPVRWLYVLRDGALVAPTSAADGVSFFAGERRPTKDNPIVGRMAFWADDETNKVNINTSSEATFWDMPLTASYADSVAPYTGLGQYQPAQNEFQRYPGHPFTTCLSPVLGRAFGWNPPPAGVPINPADPLYLTFKNSIYAMIPRVGLGGSNGGTVDVTRVAPASLDRDRLFSSVDELMFKPQLTGSGSRVVNPRITSPLIEQVKFALTANSKAPELNLYGRPRIAIWPVNANPSFRSAKDNVFAICSTVGRKTAAIGNGQYPFFFARSDPLSPDNDYKDLTRQGRNQTLYKYLQDLTAQPVPGFGGSFLAKYPDPKTANSASDRDQILTEIFDYIRCVNLSDQGNTGGKPFTPGYVDNNSDYAGQVTPIQIGNTRGFGRFPTISEAAVVFSRELSAPANPQRMRAVLILEAFTPSFGYMGMKDTYALRVDSDLRIEDPTTGAPVMLFPAGAVNLVTTGAHHGMHGRFLGGHLGFSNQFYAKGTRKALDRNSSGVESRYPFVSDWINLPALKAGETLKPFRLLGGTIRVSVYAGKNPASDPIVQVLSIPFPSNPVYLKIPTIGKDPRAPSNDIGEFETRIDAKPNNTDWVGASRWINANDSVRSIEAKTDLRLIAGRKIVADPAGTNFFFGPAGDPKLNLWAGDPNNPGGIRNVVHSLHMSLGQRYLTAVPTGVLVALPNGNSYTYPNYKWDEGNIAGQPRYHPGSGTSGDNQARMADLPEEVRGVKRLDGQPGDWDTGVSKMYDGAFINKPDEGESSDGTSIPYFLIADYKGAANTLYSPNRIIASPGWFGSLPSGLQRNHPYETLLFRPDYTKHPGLADPPDHLLLDLFDMPVVEPYPISEPFSTAGKINLNYQIVPFGAYLKRDTAMRAILRSEKMLCIPFNAVNGAKTEAYDSSGTDYQHQIDEDTTLAFLERRWTDPKPENQIFRSASQICELDLYPKRNNFDGAVQVATAAEGRAGVDVSSRWATFWGRTYALTGDNARERPYARLYGRLTTKSNTFTVHLCVQSLGKRTTDPRPDTWNDKTDSVLGEYRGSAVIERYLDPGDRRFDPNDSTVPAAERLNPDQDSLETAYRYRVLSTKRFAP